MKKKAFTLIEILVAISIGTLIVIGLYSVYVFTSKMHRNNINQQELAQNARIAMERISRDLRQAQEIATILPPTNTDNLNPPPNYITFQDGHNSIADPEANPEVGAKIRYIKYYLNGTNLRRQVLHYSFSTDPDTWVKYDALNSFNQAPTETVEEDVIKADKISSIQFFGNTPINIQLTVSNNDNNFTFSTKIWGRNI